MPTWQWADGGPVPRVSAQTFGEFVEQLRGTDDGVIAKQIVEAARSRRSPIHNLFLWDDAREAELYRVVKARHYLGRLMRVDVKSGAPSAREYHIIINGSQKYMPRENIIGNDDRMVQVLRQIEADLGRDITRYRTWLVLTPAGEHFDRALAELRSEIARLNNEAEARITRPRRGPRRPGAGPSAHV